MSLPYRTTVVLNLFLETSKSYNMDSPAVQLVANALSIFTIISCLFLKVPQIMHMRRRRSAEGIYAQALLMEITGFTIVTLYNFTNRYSVMTYLEYPIILVQIYVMLYYVLKFNRMLDEDYIPILIMFYISITLLFACEIVPKNYLSHMIPICTPLSSFAKIAYIYGIVKAGNANTVSLTTWIISIITNLARLFTVLADSSDFNLICNFIISALLSIGVLATAVYYQFMKPKKPVLKRQFSSKASEECRKMQQFHTD